MTGAPTLPPPPAKTLALATAAAAAAAGLVLVVAVLPAEYGVDPTGIGEALGLTALHGGAAAGPAGSFGNASRDLQVVRAEWRLTETQIGVHTGTAGNAESAADIRFPLNLSNLTKVRAVLTWVDDGPGHPATEPDWFDFQILGPQGAASQLLGGPNEAGREGRLAAELVWSAARLPAHEANGTRLPGGPPDNSSHGEWRVRARLLRSEGPAGGGSDPGTAWRIEVFATTYATHVVASDRPADRVRIVLPGHHSLEYKLAMETGDALTYAWTATAPLYFDLHGDTGGEASTTYREGTAREDAGSYTAPFAGRHGWYFRNPTGATVTVELETRGTYRILGFS